MSIDPLLADIGRLFLGFLFLSTAFHKARSYDRFENSVLIYKLMPSRFVPLVARALLGIECVLGLLLVMEIAIPVAAAGALLVFCLYFTVMGVSIARGIPISDCGCSLSSRKAPLTVWHLLRSAILVGVAVLLLLPQAERPLYLLDQAQVAGALIALGALYLNFDGLLSNLRHGVGK